VAGLLGLGIGEFIEHEKDENRRIDELERREEWY
jgi:hypothetical protein